MGNGSYARIEARLAALAGSANFAFAPPLSEAALDALQARLGRSVPAAYRRVLTQLTAGHPAHPLLPRELPSADALPFPYDARDAEASRSGPIDSADAGSGYATLVVWDHGCGEESHLVLDGPSAGSVWRSTELGWMAEPLGEPGGDFADWLAWWLETW